MSKKLDKFFLIKIKPAKILPFGKTGAKTIDILTSDEKKFRLKLDESNLLFEVVGELNKLGDEYENVIFVNKSFKHLENWYKVYLNWKFPPKWFEREFIYSPYSLEKSLETYQSLEDILKDIRTGKNALRETKISKVPIKGILLPEVRKEIVEILKTEEEDNLPLALSEKEVFTEESYRFIEEFREKAKEYIEISSASYLKIDRQDEENLTELKNIRLIKVIEILAKYFYRKYLDLAKQFEGFYRSNPLPLEKVFPQEVGDKKLLATLLEKIFEKSNFDYKLVDCNFLHPQILVLKSYIFNQSIPLDFQLPKMEYSTLLKNAEKVFIFQNKIDEDLLADLFIAFMSKHTPNEFEEFSFIASEKLRKYFREKLKRLKIDLEYIGENIYFDAFFMNFQKLFPDNLLTLEMGKVDKSTLKKLECEFLSKEINPLSSSILKDAIENLPPQLKPSISLDPFLPFKLSLIGLFKKISSF